jgi:predicted TIM-barrel fold metal-dependent hydrolase
LEGAAVAKFINVHCHLLNYQFIPPSCFKTRSAVTEWLVRLKGSVPLVHIVASLVPRIGYRRLHDAIGLMKIDVREVARHLRAEMDEAGFQLAVPLMMDLGRSSFKENPPVPFTFQIKMLSDIALEHLGVIMPFVMVDPRRGKAADTTIRSLEHLGFLGLKMYPPLGYHPDPESFYNEPQVNEELNKIYEYCERNSVPITTHCSPGGAYSSDLMRAKEVRIEFTKPWSWAGVMKKYPKLYLNLAHFGQDMIRMKEPGSWASGIRDLIHNYPNVYTDLAYNQHALVANTNRQYFEILNHLLDKDPLLKDKVLFATDWSMTRHTWMEKEYLAPFLKNLDESKMNCIAFENPLNFLFPQRKFPERIARFLRASGKSVSDLPKWLLANLVFDRPRM